MTFSTWVRSRPTSNARDPPTTPTYRGVYVNESLFEEACALILFTTHGTPACFHLITVTSTMRRAAHPSGYARSGAGAGCSAIRYQYLSPSDLLHQRPANNPHLPTRGNVQWFLGGLVFKAQNRLCVSLNSRLERNQEEEGTVSCTMRSAYAVLALVV